jgi:hypothetical protein
MRETAAGKSAAAAVVTAGVGECVGAAEADTAQQRELAEAAQALPRGRTLHSFSKFCCLLIVLVHLNGRIARCQDGLRLLFNIGRVLP